MKATEFRLDNIVSCKEGTFKIRSISRSYDLKNHYIKDLCLVTLYDDNKAFDLAIKDINPIPLTEEWIKRLGFVEVYRDNGLRFNLGEFNWYESKRGNRSVVVEFDSGIGGDHYDFCPDCEYVHQLQNLYFALTGNELEIKQ